MYLEFAMLQGCTMETELAKTVQAVLRERLAEKLAAEEAKTRADVDAFLLEWYGLSDSASLRQTHIDPAG